MAQHGYSASNNAFYPFALQTTYETAGTWPDDVIEITDEEAATYMGTPPAGQTRAAGPDGHPTWVDLPPPTLKQQAQAMLYATVTVQCTSKPALNADYSINTLARQKMNSVITSINSGHGLPSVTVPVPQGQAQPTPTFNWPDSSGAAHDWPQTQFVAFADKVSKFTYQLDQVIGGHDTVLPSTTLVIP